MNFSNDYKMKIATWEKKLPEIVKYDNYKWIAKNHKKIYEYITTHDENKNTLKGHISVLSGILRELDPLPGIQKKYSKIATWEKKIPEIVKDDNYKLIAKNHKIFYEYITTHYEN